MTVVSRYLARRFWGLWWPVAGGFLGLFLVVEAFEKLRLILKYSPRAADMALFFAARVPWMLTQILPMSGLLAAAFAVAGLVRRGELAALRAGGLSLARLSVPFVASGLLLAVGHAGLQELVAPRGFALARQVKNVRIKGRSEASLVRTTDLWLRVPGGFVHVDRLDPRTMTLTGVQIARVQGGRMRERVSARTGRWDGRGWVLESVEARRFRPDGTFETERLERSRRDLGLTPRDLTVEKVPMDAITWRELRRRIERNRRRGFDTLDLEVGLWAKTALPAATALLPLLAFSLGVGGPPRGTGVRGVLTALAAAVAFGLAQAVSLSLGRTGAVPPPLAAWAPPVAFALLAWWTLRRAETSS
ncbi:LPS export ABC transporter permease LptG [Deferrisoma camini]|uniref:LPS export ABC transporter permease LptG n=1 Tax=Deferrisoma camini TaxID=1035120 RepID=UPI00046D3619|nr:LPS export ABC transporter permease LptG [Deferrisoma camini]